MTRITAPLILLALLAFQADAASILIQGVLAVDDQTPSILFTVNSPEVVTIQSFGYAGGTVDVTTIPGGGFDPSAFVFDSTGQLVADSGGACVTGADAITGNCDDPFIQQPFTAGQYTLLLTVSNNFLNDTSLADGFQEDGAGSYTCAPYSEAGNFCDVSTATGTPRTGNWAVAITGADSASLPSPEPGGWGLVSLAGAALALRTLRRRPVA